jgi:predicted P-loop ATPase
MHDPILKNIKYNQHKFAIEATKLLPWGHIGNWRDEDDSQLLVYMQRYGQQTRANMFTAIQKVADDRKFHPILEYLETLEWDGIDRLDTLFMDYLGAEDTHLNRIMTRKTFCAAVARVYHPGIKFDTMLVLKGEQGIGKGRLLRRMAVNDDWFNDSMRLNDTKDKTAAELIQGYWIIEIGELAGLSRIDERVLKSFLSRQDDVYRQSYGRRSQSHLRQCIFIGTTNEHEFLTDITGNRRYWIIPCMTNKPSFSIDGMLDYEVNQIWAEALYQYRHKETLYLGGDDIKALNLVHEAHFVDDPLVGLVKEFLESTEKTKVCTLEIWVELLMNDMKSLNYNESRRISNAMRKIEGWVKTTPRRFGQYGTQKGWEKR